MPLLMLIDLFSLSISSSIIRTKHEAGERSGPAECVVSYPNLQHSIYTRIKPARNEIILMVRKPIFQASDWSSDTVANTTVSLDQSEAWKIGLRTIKTISFLADFILD